MSVEANNHDSACLSVRVKPLSISKIMRTQRSRGRPRTLPDTPLQDAIRADRRDRYYVDDEYTWISGAIAHQRHLARKLAIPCDLTRDDVKAKIDEANGVCCLSGITLNYQRGRKTPQPDTACLAMIDPDGFLTKDNMRVISWEAKRRIGQQQHKTFLGPKVAPLLFQMRGKQTEITRLTAIFDDKQSEVSTLSNQLDSCKADLIRMQAELLELIKYDP